MNVKTVEAWTRRNRNNKKTNKKKKKEEANIMSSLLEISIVEKFPAPSVRAKFSTDGLNASGTRPQHKNE